MKILIGFLIAVCCFGQNTGQNVVTQVAVTSRSLLNTTVTYTCDTVTCSNGLGAKALQNVGQTNHAIIVDLSASGNNNNVICLMQGSIDGVTFYSIGIANTQLTISGAQQYRCYGYGSYPYLRTSVTINAASGGATFSVTYLGNSIPSNSLVDMSGLNAGISWNHPVSNMTTGGVQQIVITGVAGRSISVYALELVSDATATELHWFCTPQSSATWVIYGMELIPVSGPLIYQIGLRPWFTCQSGSSLAYTLTGTPVATYAMAYRFE